MWNLFCFMLKLKSDHVATTVETNAVRETFFTAIRRRGFSSALTNQVQQDNRVRTGCRES